jgi:hypothetical protein
MKIATDLQQLIVKYPDKKDVPRDLLKSEIASEFISTSKLIPFREQFLHEESPHVLRNCHFQYGNIKNRKAIKFFHRKKPVRLIYANAKDSFQNELLSKFPARIIPPTTSTSSNIARILRELALKWVVEQFFEKIGYLTFDEPMLEGVNPDCLVVPAKDANKILQLPSLKKNKDEEYVSVEIDSAFFVEIKAYHQDTFVGEKEVMQSFNYAVRGGKALLIHTGNLGDLDGFDIINSKKVEQDSTISAKTHYDQETYDKFVKHVKSKNRQLLKKIDYSKGQDAFDNRGIYLSASTKIKKMYKYTSKWPSCIEFKILKTPEDILSFISSQTRLGIITPKAFKNLLISLKLKDAADLFSNIRSKYIEEILLTPSILYPK